MQESKSAGAVTAIGMDRVGSSAEDRDTTCASRVLPRETVMPWACCCSRALLESEPAAARQQSPSGLRAQKRSGVALGSGPIPGSRGVVAGDSRPAPLAPVGGIVPVRARFTASSSR